MCTVFTLPFKKLCVSWYLQKIAPNIFLIYVLENGKMQVITFSLEWVLVGVFSLVATSLDIVNIFKNCFMAAIFTVKMSNANDPKKEI